MGLKGLVSVCISLNFFVMYTWTTTGFPSNGIWKVYSTCLKFTQNIIILFWFSLWVLVKLVSLCNQCLHVMLCQIKTNATVIETWILSFYFYSTFPLARKTIKLNVKLNTSIKKYPTPPVSPKYHLWEPILERNGVCIHILSCNLHISDLLFV